MNNLLGRSVQLRDVRGQNPLSGGWISGGYPPGIRWISAGYPPSGKRVLGDGRRPNRRRGGARNL